MVDDVRPDDEAHASADDRALSRRAFLHRAGAAGGGAVLGGELLGAALADVAESKYGSIGAVVDAVVPAVVGLDPSARTLQASIVANARRQAKLLEQTGPIIPAAIAAGTLRIVAAVYDIGSGTVHVV
ncbi:MAG TPA: twin-arginine translocation signal domain-containing protein [Solirubrobacteraceae bacterium]|jgi:carbonic anhydrase|nr:twin-arginine translocation signal domain-containing protein [Solirubrobacteraceae bacterium]